MCSLLSTYFLVFLQDYFIHFTVKNKIILFLPVKFIPWLWIVPAVIRRPTISILRTEISQDLAFV